MERRSNDFLFARNAPETDDLLTGDPGKLHPCAKDLQKATRDEIIRLLGSGLDTAQVAERTGVSRKRVGQIKRYAGGEIALAKGLRIDGTPEPAAPVAPAAGEQKETKETTKGAGWNGVTVFIPREEIGQKGTEERRDGQGGRDPGYPGEPAERGGEDPGTARDPALDRGPEADPGTAAEDTGSEGRAGADRVLPGRDDGQELTAIQPMDEWIRARKALLQTAICADLTRGMEVDDCWLTEYNTLTRILRKFDEGEQ